MSAETGIAWCDSTWNPWIGCTRVSTEASGGGGCDHCYAAVSTPARTLGIAWGAGEPRRRTSAQNWGLPERWNREHAAFEAEHGRRRRVFCASLADVFDNEVSWAWRADALAIMARTTNLEWLVLTKRIGNVRSMVPPAWLEPGGWPEHIRLGVTIVTQREAIRDLPKLLALPCPTFASVEPMLGPMDLHPWLQLQCSAGSVEVYAGTKLAGARPCPRCGGDRVTGGCPGLEWVIIGGESGHHARPFNVDDARLLMRQCHAAGVPVFMKQMGAYPVTHGFTMPGERWPRRGDELEDVGGRFRVRLQDRAGANPAEWPEDLCMQEWPR